MHPRPVLIATLAVLSGVASAATFGDPSHPETLEKDITAALAGGAKTVTVTPGVYQLPQGLGFRDLVDVTLDFTKVELSLHSERDGVVFGRCRDTVFTGATIHYDHPRFSQAKILAFGSENQQVWYEVQVDAGYPVDAPWKSCVIFTPNERRIKFHTWDSNAKAVTKLDGAGHLRVAWDDRNLIPPHSPVAVGDYLVCRGDGSSLLHTEGCVTCTFKDLNFYWGGIFGIFETGPSEANHYLRIAITPGAMPTGATNLPFISQSADGLHSAAARRGPLIESCDFECMLDDAVAIHGYFAPILEVAGPTLMVKEHTFRVGDQARVSSDKGFLAEATVAKIEHLADQRWAITLNKDVAATAGCKIGNPSASGNGYQIIDNTIRGNRARGILVKGDNGLIEGNTIEGSTMSGISVGPEYWWNEGDYCQHVAIRNNTIRHTNYATNDFGNNGAILVHGDGTRGNRDIVITGNRIEDVLGANIIIGWADGVKVADNTFTGFQRFDLGTEAKHGALILLDHCANVAFAGNSASEPGPFAKTMLLSGKEVAGVTGADTGLVKH
ncbi:MAG: right-handed parallel beta-helix repeat-containing protein [Planctomycetes bacterium]|nr:right-handed parallel beta-helix repeat-containing protein [Planctomycetota bacterium]